MQKGKIKIFENYLYSVTYELLRLLAPLITVPYVSRVLGATGVGIYNYTQSIATYFVLLGAVGTTLYGQREIAYVQDDVKERSAIFWQITIFRFMSVFVWCIVYFWLFGNNALYSIEYKILLIEVVATAFDISWFFMGMEKFRLTVIRNTIIKIAGIMLVFIFVKEADDIPLYTFCMVVPILVGNVSLWFALPKYLTKVKLSCREILRHIKPVLILFIPQLAVEVYVVLDKTMLGVLCSNIVEVGFYSSASKIVKLCLAVITSLGTVMLPAMSYAFAKNQTDVIVNGIKKSFRFMFLIGFAILFGLNGIATNFVPIFFGAGYDSVISLIIIISPILIIIGISNVIGKQYLLPTNQQKLYTLSVITGAIVNGVLNFVLIPTHGAVGASIATVFAEISVTGIQIYAVRKQLSVFKYFRDGIQYCVCGLIMGVVVHIVGIVAREGVWGLCIQIMVGMIVYLAELLIIRDELLLEGKKMFVQRRRK